MEKLLSVIVLGSHGRKPLASGRFLMSSVQTLRLGSELHGASGRVHVQRLSVYPDRGGLVKQAQEPKEDRSHPGVCGGSFHRVPLSARPGGAGSDMADLCCMAAYGRNLCFSGEARSPDFSVEFDF